jgi:multidrug efflux pump subunit AcrB
MAIGRRGNALNNGNFFITLKPRDERKATADQIIARLRPKLAKVEGASTCSAGGAGRQRRRPPRARSTSTRCRTPTSTS